MEKYARYVEMNGMGILYEIATNKTLELYIRYAAARQMQSMRSPKPKKVRNRDYKEEYRRRIELEREV